jgi:hypothetical protein
MKRITKLFLLVPAAFVVFGAAPAQAQIPVTDGAHIGTQIAEFFQTALRWEKELENYMEHMKKISDGRGLGMLASVPEIEQLTQAWGNYNDALNTSYGHLLNPRATDLKNFYTKYNHCNNIKDNEERWNCDAQTAVTYNAMGKLHEFMEKSEKRVQAIRQLRNAINNTEDIKLSADLTARMNGEIASLQSNTQEIQMYMSQVEQQEKLIAEQERQLYQKMLKSTVVNTPKEPKWTQ